MTTRAGTRPRRRYEYDVVLSFAGEDRKHAKKVAELLDKLGIKVFYDNFEQFDLWGKDLYEHLDDMYSNKARYCIMFLSEHYAKKLWTNHERKSAQARAFTENREYILPVRIDDTKIPGIRSTQGFLDLRKHSYQEVVAGVAHKLGKVVEEKPKRKAPRKPAILKKPTVDSTIPLHPIKKTFTDEEKRVLLTRTFTTIKRYFQAGLRTYNAKDKDVTGEIATIDLQTFICTINVRGTQRNQCKIWIGESYRSQGIYYAQGRMNTQYTTNAYNHSFHVADDGYKLFIQSSMMHSYQRQPENNQLTQRDTARQLWEIFIEPLKH